MVLEKLLQVKVSEELYKELLKEAILSGLTISQVARLRLSNKKIVDKFDMEKTNHSKFRPIRAFRNQNE